MLLGVTQYRAFIYLVFLCFFFQAEDGIRDGHVTGVQTCALPIWPAPGYRVPACRRQRFRRAADGPGRRSQSRRDWCGRRSEERRVGKEWRCRGWSAYSKEKGTSGGGGNWRASWVDRYDSMKTVLW